MQNSRSNIIAVPIKYILISDKQPIGWPVSWPGHKVGGNVQVREIFWVMFGELSRKNCLGLKLSGGGLSEGELSSYQNIWGNPGHNVQGDCQG